MEAGARSPRHSPDFRREAFPGDGTIDRGRRSGRVKLFFPDGPRGPKPSYAGPQSPTRRGTCPVSFLQTPTIRQTAGWIRGTIKAAFRLFNLFLNYQQVL